MLSPLYRFASAAILGFLFCAIGFTQATSGNIAGTVTDASVAAVAGAAITITDLDRGEAFHLQSSQDGNFSQTHLLAGRYQVKIENPGFAATTANATVEVNATTPLDVKLQPANVQTTVEVTDATPLLTTDRAEISTTLTGSQVQQLPVLDRNVTNLLLIVPGTQLNSWQHSAAENPQQGIQANVNGQVFHQRAGELSLYSHMRPVRMVHRQGGGTPETLAEVGIPALAPQFTPLGDGRAVHPGLPME